MIGRRGKDFDVILVSGEPYADHPLSPAGVIARVLDAEGWRVGVIERPDPAREADFLRLGRPRLFFGVTSGSIDSLLVNYTSLKRPRSEDPQAPRDSGIPDRALIVYANLLRRLHRGVPLVLGGIEASLRRFAHYDYWADSVRRSILLDTRAEILVYGPGEIQAAEIARRLAKGEGLDGVAGTCIVRAGPPGGAEIIPSHEEVSASKEKFVEAQRAFSNRRLIAQGHGGRFVVQYPAPEYTPEVLDRIYGLPFSRSVPADYPEFEMAKFSVVTHRGCVGRCSFCSLALHQGDRIISRSEASILDEIRRLTRHPDFKGIVDDLGGPSANMYGMDCAPGCPEGTCLDCRRLDKSHGRLIRLLRRARAVPGVKKVFVRSGIRYDLALESPEYIRELAGHHVSGLLKIAPEHVSPRVLRLMNKSGRELEDFRRLFAAASGERPLRGYACRDRMPPARRPLRADACRDRMPPARRPQHLKYYFMVAHPGTTDKDARELARFVKRLEAAGERPVEGVQIFTPTPMTRSTCMYYTGVDPETGEKVTVPKSFAEKKAQRRLLG